MSSKDNDEERVMYSSDKAHEVIEELFQSLLSRYQIGLETSMKVVISYLIVLIYHIENAIK